MQPIAQQNALMTLIERAASDPNFDTAKLAQLMEMKERWDENEARKSFNEAFARFKEEGVRILKSRTVNAGPLSGKRYAELYAVVNAITPALSKFGLSASWHLSKDDKDWLEVTCTIRHSAGHSESVHMGAPPDVGGAKNAVQARASTVSYLERYTLKAITGLAEEGDDNDGNWKGETISAEQEGTLRDWLNSTGANEQKFLEWLGVKALTDLPAKQYGEALKALKQKDASAKKAPTNA
jgi:hypothetical protein